MYLRVALATALLGCAGGAVAPSPAPRPPGPSATRAAPPLPAKPLQVTLLGTSDLHGRLTALPLYAGYVENVQNARNSDGGVVLLGDAGDMFQGTLESNLVEGASVVRAYDALGMQAVAVGNHEFDFGPSGPHTVPMEGEDGRGALKALAKRAHFPFLAANLKEAGQVPSWENVAPSKLITVRGLPVGFVGVTTHETLGTTLAANVRGLTIEPLAASIAREAASLRASGAALVVVLAHAGGKCGSFGHAPEVDQCEMNSEIFQVARALPKGAVDAIVAGHSHAGVAHEVAGIPIIQSFANGKAFGRVDFDLDPKTHAVLAARISPPKKLCPGDRDDPATCEPGSYEGAPVVRPPAMVASVNEDLKVATARKSEPLGVELPDGLRKAYDEESPEGNAFADFLREAYPTATVALMNGGGLRESLPKGKLSYGALFEAFPFDNRVAIIRTTGARLRALVASHLRRSAGIFSVSGMRVEARCEAGGATKIDLVRPGGKPIADADKIEIVTNEFLAQGGDEFWGDEEQGTKGAVTITDDAVRDVLEARLRKRSRLTERDVFDAKAPRMSLPMRRPVRCAK